MILCYEFARVLHSKYIPFHVCVCATECDFVFTCSTDCNTITAELYVHVYGSMGIYFMHMLM